MHHKVSVIMSVYNTPEKWLRQSIESVLNQTFKDFEFIIYEDCPTDNSEIIIDEYAKKDCRLRVVKNSVNKGLTRNLYEAVKISTGDYIARMDSDDICELDRLEKQVSYMDNNENVIVLGSYVNVFSESYNTIGMINLSDSIETNRIRMLFSNSGVAHPSAIIRRKFLIDKDINYRIEYAKSQDYGLWVDIIDNGGEIKELHEILLNYRVHDNQISKKNKIEQNACVLSIITYQLEKLFDKSDININLHMGLNSYDQSFSKKEYIRYIKLLLKTNNIKQVYDKKTFKNEILALWQKIVIRKVIKFRLHYLLSWTSFISFKFSVLHINFKKYKKIKEYKKILKTKLKNEKEFVYSSKI